MTRQQAFERVTADAINSVERLRLVFEKNRHPLVADMMEGFVQGYITWHFCEKRYMLPQIYEKVAKRAEGIKFRNYFDEIRGTGWVDPAEWTRSLVVEAVGDKGGE